MSGEIAFTPTASMLEAAYGVHYSRPSKKQIIGYIIFGGLMGLALAMIDEFSSLTYTLGIIALTILWALFVLMVIILLTRYWWLPRFTRRIFKQQSELRLETTIRWSKRGYETEVRNGKQIMEWADFYQWRRSNGMLLIYRSEALFNFFPDNAPNFVDAADEIQSFLIAAGIKEKK
jgi:hypothetical protein